MDITDMMNAESLVVRHILGLVLEQVQISEQPHEFEESMTRAMAIDPQYALWSDERKQGFIDRAMLHYRIITMPSTTPPNNLPDKERELILSAWSGASRARGLIIVSESIGASYLIAGGQQFDFHDDNRLAAEYKEAIENLRRYGLVEHSVEGGYRLTATGYRLGDLYSNQPD